MEVEAGTVTLKLMGRHNKTLIERQFSPTQSSLGRDRLCKSHIFHKNVVFFEEILCHLPNAMVYHKNLFLIGGLLFATTAVSMALSTLKCVFLMIRKR